MTNRLNDLHTQCLPNRPTSCISSLLSLIPSLRKYPSTFFPSQNLISALFVTIYRIYSCQGTWTSINGSSVGFCGVLSISSIKHISFSDFCINRMVYSLKTYSDSSIDKGIFISRLPNKYSTTSLLNVLLRILSGFCLGRYEVIVFCFCVFYCCSWQQVTCLCFH